jgi:hypothetical protein
MMGSNSFLVRIATSTLLRSRLYSNEPLIKLTQLKAYNYILIQGEV